MGSRKGMKQGPRTKKLCSRPNGKYIKIGDLFRDSRITLGYTQEDLAKVIGVSRPLVTHWEHGNLPAGAAFIRLIFTLKLDSEKLLDMINEVDCKEEC